MLTNVLITLFSFFMMEGVAWFTHKYVMHGFLWYLHKDHHVPNNKTIYEKNDFFFLVFALPGMALIWLGFGPQPTFLFYLGLGIALYGFAYFVVHDIFIHQRIKVLRKSSSPYLMALRRAHKVHHKNIHKHEGRCFGMLVVPFKYYKEAKKMLSSEKATL